MIKYTQGDILQDDAEAIINTVNCVGVMGRGIALQFKMPIRETLKRIPKRASTTRFALGICLFTKQTNWRTRVLLSTSPPNATGAAPAGWKILKLDCMPW